MLPHKTILLGLSTSVDAYKRWTISVEALLIHKDVGCGVGAGVGAGYGRFVGRNVNVVLGEPVGAGDGADVGSVDGSAGKSHLKCSKSSRHTAS